LDEDIDDITVLVYGAIEIMLFTVNANEHLVHMPDITILTIPPTQSIRVAWPEFLAPPPDHLL